MGTVDGAAVLRPTTSPAPPPVAMTLDCNENHVKGLFYKYSYGGYILGRRIRELYGMLPVSATEMAQIWELADSDRDGKLSIDEFINFSRFLSTKLRQVSYGMDAVRVLYVDFFR